MRGLSRILRVCYDLLLILYLISRLFGHLTGVKSFPRPDGRLFSAALQLVLSVQEPLDFHRRELIDVFQFLEFSETLRSPACGKTGRSFWFLVHIRFHALGSFHVYAYIVII